MGVRGSGPDGEEADGEGPAGAGRDGRGRAGVGRAPGATGAAGALRALRARVPLRVRVPLGAADRDVLALYLFTRIGLWVTAYCARWIFAPDGSAHRPESVMAPWMRWDATFYRRIAQHGYFPPGQGPGTQGWDNREAFFPGYPMALRAVHLVVPSWTAAGLLISFAAGAVAVLALARIAGLDLAPGDGAEPGAGWPFGHRDAGRSSGKGDGGAPGPGRGDRHRDAARRTVLFFLLSPCAIFLAIGYTEALFLAFALPAWLAARRRNWAAAGVLAALATTVRVNGVFLGLAIGVQLLLGLRAAGWGRTLRELPWIALPAVPPLLYTWFLHAHTGDWMAWKHAENRGWYRDFHPPWTAWQHTWDGAFAHTQSTGYAFMFQAELAAMVLGLLLLALLLARRRWAESLYLALTLWALSTSYWYMSVPRSTLLWWPLWTALAGWTLTRPRLTQLYLCAVAPLTTVYTLTFLTGHWTG